jgi:hypothetical protein
MFIYTGKIFPRTIESENDELDREIDTIATIMLSRKFSRNIENTLPV